MRAYTCQEGGGHPVFTAHAVLLSEHPEIDLLFIDIAMLRMDGVTLADKVRTLRPNLLIVTQPGSPIESAI